MFVADLPACSRSARYANAHARTLPERAVLYLLALRRLTEDDGEAARASFALLADHSHLGTRATIPVLHGTDGLLRRGLVDLRPSPNPRTGEPRLTYGLTSGDLCPPSTTTDEGAPR
jgi:hypothetical protein